MALAELVIFDMSQTEEARAANRLELAVGVAGKKCLMVVHHGNIDLHDSLKHMVPPGWIVSSVEVYENGAVNLYVHQNLDITVASAFIRVRPS